MKALVEKPFPFAEDGVNTRQVQKGDEIEVTASMFVGLERDGYIKASGKSVDLDGMSRVADTEVDRVLAAASDAELKAIIARSGKPYSGNLVHAVMVAQAKVQLLKEASGKAPERSADPDAGVTEQPLSKPGEATPPSAKAESASHAKHPVKK